MDLNIEDIINSNEGYCMFARDECFYCSLAEEYFKDRDLKLDVIKINDYEERLIVYEKINEYLDRDDIKTMPQIFFNSNYIGGSDSLDNYFSKLEFKNMDKNIRVYTSDDWLNRHSNPFLDPEIMKNINSSGINYQIMNNSNMNNNANENNANENNANENNANENNANENNANENNANDMSQNESTKLLHSRKRESVCPSCIIS